MQEHYKKLYLMATRHNDFIAHKAISNYLSNKQKNEICCQPLLNIGKSLKEVRFTFDGENEQRQNKRNIKLVQLLGVRNNKRNTRRKGNSLKEKNMQSLTNITIIENEQNHQQSNPQMQRTKLVNQLQPQTFQSPHQLHLKQSQLDMYIDQYLYKIVNGDNSLLREQLQSDRRGFIEKAIMKIKENIIKEKRNDIVDENQNGNENVLKTVVGRQQGKSQYFLNKQCHGENYNIKKKTKQVNKSLQATKQIQNNKKIQFSFTHQAPKTKSTHTIPLLPQKHLPTISNTTLTNSSNTTTYPISSRSIYNSTTPSSQFIQRVGQTFYMNEVKMLNKITQLEMKNRQRANRWFRRRLVSLEKGSLGEG